MPLVNDYSLLPAATIADMLATAIAKYKAILNSQEYTQSGRHQRNVDLADTMQVIQDLSIAYQKATGTITNLTKYRFEFPYPDGDPLANVGNPIAPLPPPQGAII